MVFCDLRQYAAVLRCYTAAGFRQLSAPFNQLASDLRPYFCFKTVSARNIGRSLNFGYGFLWALLLLPSAFADTVGSGEAVTVRPALHPVLHSKQDTGSKAAMAQKAKMPFKPVGQARYSVLFWDIYDCSLWTPSGQFAGMAATSQTADLPLLPEPVRLQIRYLRDVTAAQLVKATVEQWQHLGIAAEAYQQYPQLLKAIWPDLQQGDELALEVNSTGAAFYFNNQFLANIDDPQFGPLFLAIWLAENTSEPALRRRLIQPKTAAKGNY